MPITPDQYGRTAAYDLLAAAARGHVAFDRRLIDALTTDPAHTLPDLIRFSREDRTKDRVDIGPDLVFLFMRMPDPEAVPFLVREIEHNLQDAPHELIELANRLGAPAAEALLDLFDRTGRSHSEVLFVALMAGARGPRVDEAIDLLDAQDASLFREIASEDYQFDPGEPSAEYPAEASPDLSVLPEKEREEFLLSDVAEQRLAALSFYLGQELSDRRRQQLLEMGGSDPDARVRGLAWEVLREYTEEAPVLRAMTARLKLATDLHERACLANALAYHSDIAGVVEAIEAAYADPAQRAKALEAMWRSLDRRWVARIPQHLDDPDIEVRRQAILATGYFELRNHALRLEPFLRDADLREDAIHAYALAAPGGSAAFDLHQLEKRIVSLAGGLGEDEEQVLAEAFEIRQAMAGRGSPIEAKPEPAAAGPKIGRNDPCPCGSGRKYKKCCGSVN